MATQAQSGGIPIPIVADGVGGAVIGWVDYRGSYEEIYGQRVNASGVVQWTANGKLVSTGGQRWNPTLVPDKLGGAIFAFEDIAGGNTNILATHMDGSGNTAWAKTVSNSPLRQMAPSATTDDNHGAIIAWQDNRAGTGEEDVYAMHLEANGDQYPGWTTNGTPICAASNSQQTPCIVADGSGGGIVSWNDGRSASPGPGLYAQRVNSDGRVLWSASGLKYAGTNIASESRVISYGGGDAAFAWVRDNPSTTKYDIYAQKITEAPLPVYPKISSISPTSYFRGNKIAVTVRGSGFASGAQVSFLRKGCPTLSASSEKRTSSSYMTCKLTIPSGAPPGDYSVKVVNPDGRSGTKSSAFEVIKPSPLCTWYLAEGSTANGFVAHICIENPNSSSVHADVTYMPTSGKVQKRSYLLPAHSQYTIRPSEAVGQADFSTKVVCREGKPICVDRYMTWPGGDAHSSVGVTSPARTWYLPEGSSKWGFECWLLIQNPNAKAANCTITFMIEGEGPVPVQRTIKPNSRDTLNMADDIGAHDASIKVSSDVPVIPERAMYRNNRREGHDSIGTTTPANDYYLAEGSVGYASSFITYVLVQNPNGSPADVSLTYQTQSGVAAGPSFQMPPNSRHTIEVNKYLPPDTDVSTLVHGSQPIIAERAMYWRGGPDGGEACHDSIGMSSPHTTFYLPDGETSRGWETWTLVQNPNGAPVEVKVSYLPEGGGGTRSLNFTIPGNSRHSFKMAEQIPSGRAAVVVTSKTPGRKIMVERSMYWNNRQMGTDTIGGYSE
jgi:IPT/TIG domain